MTPIRARMGRPAHARASFIASEGRSGKLHSEEGDGLSVTGRSLLPESSVALIYFDAGGYRVTEPRVRIQTVSVNSDS